jgi:hypothetical protein
MAGDLEGADELMAALQAAGSRGPDLLDAALYNEALQIFAESQQIVPVDTGTLRNTGVVEPPKDGTVLIGYGGPATPYALTVHEDLEAGHKEGKTAKFLERPFTSALNGLEGRLSAAIRGGLGG